MKKVSRQLASKDLTKMTAKLINHPVNVFEGDDTQKQDEERYRRLTPTQRAWANADSLAFAKLLSKAARTQERSHKKHG